MEAGLENYKSTEGTPADKAGVQAGDYIVKEIRTSRARMTLLDAVKLTG